MLKTLRRIVQEVTAANNLTDALQLMVWHVKQAMQTQAATIFLTDTHRSELVLMATEGLNPDAVGNIRISLDQGLIGYVGQREEPINLENAREHPAFVEHPDVGEEEFKAFLGVPIIHHRRLYGVLAIQQQEQRCYDETEEAFMVTIAAQLGAVIAHSEATGELGLLEPFHTQDIEGIDKAAIGGIPSVTGVGIGHAVVVYPPADLNAVPDRDVEDIEQEITVFKHALNETRQDMQRLSDRLDGTIPKEEHALFDVYLRILDDNHLGQEVIKVIQEKNLWAQSALRIVIKHYINQFDSMDDEYLRERASDIRDLGHRVLAQLQETDSHVVEYPQETILVGDEVTAAALAEVPEGHLKAIVSANGSNTSHVAILARALGVPTVMGAKGMSVSRLSNTQLIVDGYFGQVYVDPSDELLTEFRRLAKEEDELNDSLAELRDLPAETPDGHRISLQINTGLAVDASISLSVGAEGVGLYRSEFPFMTRECFPSEEEQRIIYRQLLNAFAPRPVTMRTLDIGGDKQLPYFPVQEENPFLGWRGIRVTLDHPDVFLIQVRAMLQASDQLNNLRIMLPMISGVAECDEAIHLIEQAYSEVVEEGLNIERPQVGVMIEVPSAIYQSRELASRVDFVSIGSNDLTQYLLAVDRNNSRVANLYDPLHPSVLRAIMQVVENVHAEGKPVSLCGEMAADPAAMILLLAMGFDALSMNSSSLPRMKWVIRNFSMQSVRKILSEVLSMDNAALIRFHLEKAIDSAGLGGLIRAGKR